MPTARSSKEIWRAFEIQKQALQISMAAYDIGFKGEAVRLANSIFLLVGRGMRNHNPILDQLGLLNNMNFPTTVPEDGCSGNPLYEAELRTVSRNSWTVELFPAGRGSMMTGRALKYDPWWNEIVMQDSGRSLSRGTIIRAIRDQDGGAHFDGQIRDPIYAAATRGEITGFLVQLPSGDSVPVPYGLETTVRQIAEEISLPLRCHTPPIEAR